MSGASVLDDDGRIVGLFWGGGAGGGSAASLEIRTISLSPSGGYP